jgi:2-desacetyl-2-hydroxyethyl bacteriochlorophyllide A dehydrogenase
MMRAAVLDGRGGVQLTDRPEPVPGADDVVIAPSAVGICGTDLHLADGSYATGRFPVVPGHEFTGMVAGLGRKVRKFTEGDLVGVDPNVSCGGCKWCKAGAMNLCRTLEPVGVTRDGACAELVAVPARVVYKLPSGLSPTVGALIEPLACVLHALDRLHAVVSRDVLIYGAGSIGLIAAAVCRAEGAARIQIVEPFAIRREAALRMGVHAAAPDPAELDLDGGAEVVIDASGNLTAITDALSRVAIRGTFVQMGVTARSARVSLAPFDVFEKELTILGSNSVADQYGAATELAPDLAEPLSMLVTHRLPLEDYANALAAAASPEAIKVHVIPSS